MVVWAVVSTAAIAAAGAVPGAWTAVDGGSTDDAITDLLVAACSATLALALGWLWVITTLTVGALLTDSTDAGRVHHRSGATRRLVLLACGVAVVAGTALPATATGGDGREVLVGLTLPERAVATARPRPSHVVRPSYVVRPGDSLWSIADDHPVAAASVDQRWRAIWLANRDVVGDDPDLIIPGQALRLPAPEHHPTHDPNSDGDR